MNIFIIGQTSLHWGRMEFGNIGNFYVIDPFFKEIKRVFPNCKIKTTIQMSERYCAENDIEMVPLDLYYSWDDKDFLNKCFAEYAVAILYKKTGSIQTKSPFINEVLWADLVIDMSGDVWGDNADFAGPNRFLVGLLKDRVAQLLDKPVVMLAGSPGPFANHREIHKFTKEVFEGFDFVTNRENTSIEVLKQYGFDVKKVNSYACPAFLFEGVEDEEIELIINNENLFSKDHNLVGFILCGWNMAEGPYSKWPRKDEEYSNFVEIIEFMINKLNLRIVLYSHNNGFEKFPVFKITPGRDYPVVKQLFEIVRKREKADPEKLTLINGVYSPRQMKTIIKQFDMQISGRVHGSVASLSQFIPTVMIDYGHEPKAHKVKGFARVVQIENYLADPSDINDLKEKILLCWENRIEYRKHLIERIPVVKDLARKNFEELRNYFNLLNN